MALKDKSDLVQRDVLQILLEHVDLFEMQDIFKEVIKKLHPILLKLLKDESSEVANRAETLLLAFIRHSLILPQSLIPDIFRDISDFNSPSALICAKILSGLTLSEYSLTDQRGFFSKLSNFLQQNDPSKNAELLIKCFTGLEWTSDEARRWLYLHLLHDSPIFPFGRKDKKMLKNTFGERFWNVPVGKLKKIFAFLELFEKAQTDPIAQQSIPSFLRKYPASELTTILTPLLFFEMESDPDQVEDGNPLNFKIELMAEIPFLVTDMVCSTQAAIGDIFGTNQIVMTVTGISKPYLAISLQLTIDLFGIPVKMMADLRIHSPKSPTSPQTSNRTPMQKQKSTTLQLNPNLGKTQAIITPSFPLPTPMTPVGNTYRPGFQSPATGDNIDKTSNYIEKICSECNNWNVYELTATDLRNPKQLKRYCENCGAEILFT